MSSSQSDLLAMLSQFLPLLPLLLVWLAGGVLALITWRRHPMVSLLVLAAVSLLVALSVAGTLATWWVIRSSEVDFPRRGWALTVLGFVRALGTSIAYILLLVAAFGWRRLPHRWPGPDETEVAEPATERVEPQNQETDAFREGRPD